MTLVSITSFKLLISGRIIAGFCDGVLAATVPRYIEEYLPLSYYTIGSLIFTCSANAGSLIALFDGLVLPHEKGLNYYQELADYDSWRYIFGLPLALYFINFIMTSFLIKTEGPKFYIVRGQNKKAISVIKTIYNIENNPLIAEQIYS